MPVDHEVILGMHNTETWIELMTIFTMVKNSCAMMLI